MRLCTKTFTVDPPPVLDAVVHDFVLQLYKIWNREPGFKAGDHPDQKVPSFESLIYIVKVMFGTFESVLNTV